MLKKLKNWLVTFNLTFVLTLNLFFIIMAVLGCVTVTCWLGVRLGWLAEDFYLQPYVGLVVAYVICILLGVSVVVMIRLVILEPMRRMVGAMKRLASGDFSVRMTCEGFARPSELREFTAAFNTAAAELSNTEILRKDFVNNFSHEFKTPITSLGGFADLLLEGDVSPEEQREYLGIISSEAHRLASLATNVLALSKLEAQAILTDKKAFDLTEQLRQTALMMQQKWRQKQPDIRLEAAELTCTGSEELLAQVWTNLLDNAIKFSPAGGRITLSLQKAEKELVCTVRDQGPGMDDATQARIFDQFYQGDTSHATQGNGLGLAMVKKIVALHKGTVTVQSSPGAGACFTVRLPQDA